MTPEEQIKESFRFISAQGNKCEVQIVEGESWKVVNLATKEFIFMHWKKALKLLNDDSITTISGGNRDRVKQRIQRPSAASNVLANGGRKNNSIF